MRKGSTPAGSASVGAAADNSDQIARINFLWTSAHLYASIDPNLSRELLYVSSFSYAERHAPHPRPQYGPNHLARDPMLVYNHLGA